ncbi:MAG: hypothetical protein M5U22_07065 [Thermoleophilia bacterium]|nr:hypothetical protein [Thermoleophilia bacterium]
MYVILTVSWTIFSGPTNYMSLAPAAFFGIGVYGSALLELKFPLPVLVAVGGAAGFVGALAVGGLTPKHSTTPRSMKPWSWHEAFEAAA